MPLVEAIRAHVFAAERIHADDTTVPVLAKTRAKTGRLWTYVRDDRPFGSSAPPAAAFFYSPDHSGQHPSGTWPASLGSCRPTPMRASTGSTNPAAGADPRSRVLAHARRKLCELAVLARSPIASEAVQRIDRLFAVERDLIGQPAEARLAGRMERSAPILAELEPGCGTSRSGSHAGRRSAEPSPTRPSVGPRSPGSCTTAASA